MSELYDIFMGNSHSSKSPQPLVKKPPHQSQKLNNNPQSPKKQGTISSSIYWKYNYTDLSQF